MSRWFISLARWVTTRIPSEQTFSVIVRSTVAGSNTLDICNGIASRIRFSSLPDRTGIGEVTFQTGHSWLASGWTTQTICRSQQEFKRRWFSKAHIAYRDQALGSVSRTDVDR